MKYLIDRYQNIVLLKNSSLNAERCALRLMNDYNLLYIVEEYGKKIESTKNFQDINYIEFDNYFNCVHEEKTKIIILEDNKDELVKILKQLEEKGHKLFVDVFPWEVFIEPWKIDFFKFINLYGIAKVQDLFLLFKRNNRFTLMVNGNCQTSLIKEYLTHNPTFREKYCLIDIPPIHEYKHGYEEYLITNIDVIITQIISDNNKHNKFLASNYIFNHKGENTKVIKIAPINIASYFPQLSKDLRCIGIGRNVVQYADSNINELCEKNADEVFSILSNPDFYSKAYLDNHFEYQLSKFKEKEKQADVKIADWIEFHIKKEIIFYSFNHPYPKVIKEQVCRILKYMGINDSFFYDEMEIEARKKMYLQEQPIYPSVYKYLGIQESRRLIRPNSMATGFALTFRDYIGFYLSSMKGLKKKKPVKKSIAIWGSCVSREIFNYTDVAEIPVYILQNPIHTCFYNGYDLDEKNIIGTSSFTSRMLKYEFYKQAKAVIKQKKADYLMIDMSDCRSDWYELKNDSTCRIAQSLSLDRTFEKNEKLRELFVRKSVFSLTNEDWEKYVDEFCDYILSIYDEENIILNEFEFSKYYQKNGVLNEFEYSDLYKEQNRIVNLVNSYLKKRMPRMKVLSAYEEPIANYDHHLGNFALHYLDEVYLKQAQKLEKLIF